jgi:serine/threonine-protein kinase
MFPAEPVPEKIGTYQVVKYVGHNGSADLYIARAEGPLGFSRQVNLKMVRCALDDDARFAEELAREASICARLNHPGVVRMFDFFEHERRLVLVLEQVEGAGLDRLLAHLARRKQRLGDGAIFFLGGQLAAALAHAHASTDEDGNLSPVIHRDIKPENVLIGWDGQARIAGFGLGKILGRTPDSIAGTIKGTPGYMSPEQTRGERATVRSDVYGFGVLLWSLLGGKEPPTDGSVLQPLGELRPDLPRELVAAIDAALEPSPDRRRISCAELAQWLAKLVKPDAGREELRQKVLWLRATRGPAGRGETPKQQPARRRQAMHAMRMTGRRTTSQFPAVTGSSRPTPGSKRPLSGLTRTVEVEVPGLPPETPVTARSNAPTVRPTSTHPSRSGLPASARPTSGSARPRMDTPTHFRIPKPPPLPSDPDIDPNAMPSESSLSTPAVTSRPATVRTVTQAPPPRTSPPSRMLLSADNVVPVSKPPTDPWIDGAGSGVASYESVFDQQGHAPTFGPPPQELARLLTMRQESTSFPLVNQLLVAGLTAALVVALGIIFLTRNDDTRTASAAPAERPSSGEAPTVAQQPQQPPPPQPAPQPQPPAPASPATTPAHTPPMPDPSDLSDQLGYLQVKGPIDADVYLSGKRKGPTNEALLVPCGRFFMRLARQGEAGPYPEWVNRGESIFVACKSATVLTATDDAPPVQPRPRRGFL